MASFLLVTEHRSFFSEAKFPFLSDKKAARSEPISASNNNLSYGLGDKRNPNMESSFRHYLLLGTGNLAVALLAAKLLIVLCDVLTRIFGFPILKDSREPRLVFVASAIGFCLIGSVISVLLCPFAKSQPRRRTRPGPSICLCLMATVLLLAASRARGRQSLAVSIARGYVTDRIDPRNSRTVSPCQAAARIAQYRSGHEYEFKYLRAPYLASSFPVWVLEYS